MTKQGTNNNQPSSDSINQTGITNDNISISSHSYYSNGSYVDRGSTADIPPVVDDTESGN